MRGAVRFSSLWRETGGVYPCDFYVLDDLRMGTVGQESFAQMEQSEAACRFREASRRVPQACRECGAYMLCRNGCRPGPAGDGGGIGGPELLLPCLAHVFRAARRLLRRCGWYAGWSGGS